MKSRLCLALALAAGLALPAVAQTAAPSTSASPPVTRPAAPPATTAKPEAAKPAAAAPAAALIDINSASKEQLETLKGIGAARSEAIIKGRPYRGKDELVDKKILPKNVYDDVKDKIVARQKS
ncbi:MAG TPA: helix-hairpin-helix domain-containing protein [Beijerinckiaceae bacterium]